MLDFIVLDISYIDRDFLLNLPFLDFKTVVSLKTGETKEKKVAIFFGLKIILYQSKAFIKGSVHKAYNLLSEGGRAHNCNDFNHTSFVTVISLLRDKLTVDPTITRLGTLEFGVNICVPISATTIIENHFFCYKFLSGPEENKNFGKKGKYKKYAATQFQIKAYDKSRHCEMDTFVLRIELKTLKAQHTQRLNIFTLANLLEKGAMHQLGEELIKRICEILILDEYNYKASPEFWIMLKAITKPRTFLRRRKEYLEEMEAGHQFQMKKDILNRVSSKLSELIN